jgi:DNA-binding Lrp family transcriptional regulator
MKKWYFVIFSIVFFYILAAVKKKRKLKKDGIIKRIDAFINLLFWFLLIAYGLTFLYWLYRALF